MERLYVAGPITGLPDKNLYAFTQATEDLIRAGYTVYNPRNLESIAPPDAAYAWFLRMALKMMLEADGVALLPGWESSQGARLEQYVALSCALPVRPLTTWFNLAKMRHG
jgi:hypothetical protein